MIQMVAHHLRKHRYKIAVGLPVAVLLASSLSFVRSAQDICINPTDNRFVEVGELVTLDATLSADTPVNVVQGTVALDAEYLAVESIETSESVIDLWTQEPRYENGELRFAGGIIREGGFIGNAPILELTVRPLKPGRAELVFVDGQLYAHDGTGARVSCEHGPMTLIIREADRPSPDVNGDKVVNLFDFSIVSARLFMTYEKNYDLNLDGRITMADIGIIVSTLVDDSRLGSLAFGY